MGWNRLDVRGGGPGKEDEDEDQEDAGEDVVMCYERPKTAGQIDGHTFHHLMLDRATRWREELHAAGIWVPWRLDIHGVRWVRK